MEIIAKIFYSIFFILIWGGIIKYRRQLHWWTWNFVWAEHYLWRWWTYLILIIVWLACVFYWVTYPFWWIELIFKN